MLLDAVPRGVLETPMMTFTKIVKRIYYSYLFKGKVLPSLRVNADVEAKRGHTPIRTLRTWFEENDGYQKYLDQWRRPGFRFYDKEPYFVVPYRHRDVMSLGWIWKIRPLPPPDESRLDIDQFIDVIMKGRDIPMIMNRLQMLFETDPLLEIRVRENPAISGELQLVSWDKKLANRIASFMRRNRRPDSVVYLIHPVIYFLGRIEEVPPARHLLEDAGAIGHFGRGAADSNFVDLACSQIVARRERFPGVVSFHVEGYVEARPPRHVRTIGPDEGLIEELAFQGARHPDLPPSQTDYLPSYAKEDEVPEQLRY